MQMGKGFLYYLTSSLLAISIVTGGFASASDADKPSADKTGIVATVNGEDITRKELADFLIDSFGKEAVEILIRRVLIEQEAKKQGIILSKEEIDERVDKLVEFEIERLKRRYGEQGQAAFDADLEKMGYDMDKLHKKLAERLMIDVEPQMLAEKLISKTITITDEQLKDAYADRYGEKIKARHIVVKTKAEAEELLNKIKSGADFETLAKEKSLDRPSAAKGGLMSPLSPRGELGKEIASLKNREVSAIIQDRDGYHILKMEGKILPDEKKSFEEALPELRQLVMVESMQKRSGPWFLKLIEGSKIENFIKTE